MTNLPVPATTNWRSMPLWRRSSTAFEDPRRKFLAIWRLLPGELEKVHPSYARLPAETRIPINTIWNHLDITAGWKAATEGNSARHCYYSI